MGQLVYTHNHHFLNQNNKFASIIRCVITTYTSNKNPMMDFQNSHACSSRMTKHGS
ncbi:hypothetical protein Hanom_Chr17g01555061 [Helianthus anomalus]